MADNDSGAEDLETLKRRVSKRIQADGHWPQAVAERDRLIRESRALGLSKHEAQDSTYRQLDAMFPPKDATVENATAEKQVGQVGGVADPGEHHAVPSNDQAPARNQDAGVVGLDAIPADWPALPANSSLAQEIQWCQANRLSVTRTADGLTVVDLSRALQPAPSWSALGWLETSIRAYSKFVDVAAKASATVEDEREMVRRERLAIDEIRGLLAEMR
jgi:hypothetical protein